MTGHEPSVKERTEAARNLEEVGLPAQHDGRLGLKKELVKAAFESTFIAPRGLVLPIPWGPLRGSLWIPRSGWSSLALGIYDLGRARLVAEKVRAATVFYDVGASAGYYTILASRAVGENGRVVAFEPNPLNVACLKRHIELNKLGNVEIVEAAVSSHQGKLPFDPIDLRSGRLYGRLSEAGSMIVRAVKLDDLVDSGLPAPQYIKMNIEGGELEALRGARGLLAEHPVEIFLATHGEKIRQQCLDLLGEVGYATVPIGGARSELYCYKK